MMKLFTLDWMNHARHQFLKLLFFVILLLNGAQLLAQNAFEISGTVTDKNSKAILPGVGVLLVGSTTSTTTDQNGRYLLKVPNGKGVLRFSYVGYTSIELPINERKSINIGLEDVSSALDEVVIIGYGTVSRKDLTGAVGSVNIADLNKAPVVSFQQALAGRVAGVNVSSTDGQPGEGLNISIRGNSSLTQSNTPLYVVDGFPIENFNNNSLNPAEIESIDILKDASSTAVYGSRGANGVVMITTKQGKIGVTQTSFNSTLGYADASRSNLDVLKPFDFIQLQWEIDSARTKTNYGITSFADIDKYKGDKGINWYDEIVSPAPYQTYALSLSGGSQKTKYLISTSYSDQNGVVMRSGYDRFQGRIKLDQEVNNKIKVGLNINYANSMRTGIRPRDQTSKAVGSGNSQVQNLFYNLWTFRPVAAPGVNLIDEGVDPEAITYLYNPLISAQNEYDVDKESDLTVNGYLDFTIAKSLKLRVNGGANYFSNRNELFNNSRTRSGSPLIGVGRTNGVNGGLWQDNALNLTNENILTFDKTFNENHRLTAVGVASLQTRKATRFGFNANNVPNELLGVSGLDEGIVYDKISTSTSWGLLSFTSRVNYNFFKKYTITATLRADGSSKFPSNNHWGYFPSAAFAWRLSDEQFMKNLSFISNSKFRASFGITGNNRVSDFGYLPGVIQGTYYPFGGTATSAVPAYYRNGIGNDDLKWESTRQFDAGLELGFINNRLGLELDYYHKRTYDLLLNSQISTSTGYASATINIGETQNQGLEVTLNSTNFKEKNFTWTTSFNISFNKNKLLALSTNEERRFSTIPSFSTTYPSPAWMSRVGDQLVHYYGYVFDGLYQYRDFDVVNGAYVLKNGLASTAGLIGTVARQPGDIKYKDLNNDGVVNDADQTIIGNPYPKHVGGLSNNFTFKNFDLSVFLQWSYGNEILNANNIFMEGLNGSALNRNVNADYANRWTPKNQDTTVPRSKSNGISGVLSSYYIEDGSFLRIKTVSLGYNINKGLIKGIKSARIYASAQNLYTFTSYSGPDPEVSTKGYGLTPGFDFSAYPLAQTYVLGLNVTF